MAAYEVGDGRPDGTVMGQDSSEKIGFYGTTPVAQQSLTQQSGTQTATQLRAELTALQDALAALGIIAVT